MICVGLIEVCVSLQVLRPFLGSGQELKITSELAVLLWNALMQYGELSVHSGKLFQQHGWTTLMLPDFLRW